MTRHRALLLLAPLLAILVAVGLVAPHAAAEDQEETLYVSPLEVSRRVRGIVRLTNVSPAAGDIYDLTYTFLDAETGQFIATFSNVPIRSGHTLEIDAGRSIDSARSSNNLDLPPFTGTVVVVVRGTGGFTNVFGRNSVIANPLQQRGAARIPSHSRWEEN